MAKKSIKDKLKENKKQKAEKLEIKKARLIELSLEAKSTKDCREVLVRLIKMI